MTAPIEQEEIFDFSKYRAVDGEESISQTVGVEESQQEAAPFDFKKYRQKEPETKLETVGRGLARSGARAVETILGFPGDIAQLGKTIGQAVEDKDFEPNFVQRAGRKALDYIPTSESLKSVTSYLTNGFTDPQSAYEELGDEITSLATVLSNPAKATQSFPSFLKTLGKSFGQASAVKGSGIGAKTLGASEATQTGVELGMLFLTGLLSGKTADKYISERHAKARSLIPQGTVVETKGLSNELNKLEKELAKGVSTATKNEVKEAVKELKGKASGGAMEMDEIVQSYHDINERMNHKKLFDEFKAEERKQLRRRYENVKNVLSKESIEPYGRQNPEFLKLWKGANEGHSTIAKSKNISNWIQSKTGSLPKHLVGSIALDLFLGQPLAVVGVPATYGAVKGGELLFRITKSPTLRKHYMKVLLEASNENLPGMVKHLNELDKEAKKINQTSSKSTNKKM